MIDLDIDKFREVFVKYTRKAYDLIPKIEHPKILDIGCGSGVPTMELAKISNGDIIGIDVDQSVLNKFQKKIIHNNLTDRITLKQVSLHKAEFPDENFDIIWAEGSIHIIGFKKGINSCHKFLKKGGILVLGEAMNRMEKNLSLIKKYGFKLIDKLIYPEDIWLREYYDPLEKRIKELRKDDLTPNQVKKIKEIRDEIKMVRGMTPEELKCAFYILQKE